MTLAVSLLCTLKARGDFPLGKSCYALGATSHRVIAWTDHINLAFRVGKFRARDKMMAFLDFQHVLDSSGTWTDTFRIILGTDETIYGIKRLSAGVFHRNCSWKCSSRRAAATISAGRFNLQQVSRPGLLLSPFGGRIEAGHSPSAGLSRTAGSGETGSGRRMPPIAENGQPTQGPELGGAAAPLVPGAVSVALDVVLELVDWLDGVWLGLFPQPASTRAAARNGINFFIFFFLLRSRGLNSAIFYLKTPRFFLNGYGQVSCPGPKRHENPQKQ